MRTLPLCLLWFLNQYKPCTDALIAFITSDYAKYALSSWSSRGALNIWPTKQDSSKNWPPDRAISFGNIFHGHFLSLILLTGLTISASADDGPQRQGSWHPTWGDVPNQLFCFSHAQKMLQDGVPPSWCPVRRNQRFQHQTIQFLDLPLRHSIHMSVIWLYETSLTGTMIPTCNPHFMLSLQQEQKILPRECQDCQFKNLQSWKFS